MADDGITAEAVNRAAFEAALADIRRDITAPKDALTAGAKELATEAAAAAPHQSGRLAGSHQVVPAGNNKVRIAANTPYAAPIHWGWPGHGISRQPWLVATWLRNPRPLEAMTGEIQSDIDKAASKT